MPEFQLEKFKSNSQNNSSDVKMLKLLGARVVLRQAGQVVPLTLFLLNNHCRTSHNEKRVFNNNPSSSCQVPQASNPFFFPIGAFIFCSLHMLDPWRSSLPSLRCEQRRQEEVSKATEITDTSRLHCYTRWIPESGNCACACWVICYNPALLLLKMPLYLNWAEIPHFNQSALQAERQHKTIHTPIIQVTTVPGCLKMLDQQSRVDAACFY